MKTFKQKLGKTIAKYKWLQFTREDQVFGSPADLYYELYNSKGIAECFMLIDDGDCIGEECAIHICCLSTNKRGKVKYNFKGKIFEGRICSKKDFKYLMKFLGFEKIY
jgi:hypothetical protein